MKIFSLLVFAVGLVNASIDVNDGNIPQRVRFEAWIKENNMVFEGVEFLKAWFAWVDKDKTIQEVNAKSLTYKLGHNRFSHMTSEEFSSMYSGGLSSFKMDNATVDWTLVDPVRQQSAPASVDWVASGAVTPVKNQGQCNSCWAFATTGVIESAFKIAGYPLTSFSEEQLVECDNYHGTKIGCDRYHYGYALDYLKSQGENNRGLCIGDDYPYNSGEGNVGSCQDSCKAAVKISGQTWVPSNNEDALKVAVAQQPVAVSVDGDHNSDWQNYNHGVYDNPSCKKSASNHAVLLVGYGTDPVTGKDYWKIKNSWGADWGEDGYIRLARGENACGVAVYPSYPTGVEPISHHYGDPARGSCLGDETVFSYPGLVGQICAPSCTAGQRDCSTDFQPGMSATQICATTTSGGKCLLVCNEDSECGTGTCQSLGGLTSLCTYGSNANEISSNESTSVFLN